MPVKVVETINRWCCEPKDLKPYKGAVADDGTLQHWSFCQHCGQVWFEESFTDAAGGRDTRLVKGCVWKHV